MEPPPLHLSRTESTGSQAVNPMVPSAPPLHSTGASFTSRILCSSFRNMQRGEVVMLCLLRKWLLAAFLTFCTTLTAAPQTSVPISALTISSPLDFEVFQRQTRD